MRTPKHIRELVAYLEERFALLETLDQHEPDCFDQWGVEDLLAQTSRTVCRFGGPAGKPTGSIQGAMETVGRQLAWARQQLSPQSPYFDTAQACDYLGVTGKSLYALVERGRLTPLRGPRRSYRFTREMLDAYLAQNS
jgi:excisionase family DNA binding protein